jgi:hypothetical protein
MSAGSIMAHTALRYAALGWVVVPQWWVHNGRCACDKDDCNPGKHPLFHKDDLAHGVKSASKDLAQVVKWWKRWPRANIGIACGAASGIIVLDIDPRNGGDLFEFTPEPTVPLVLTGGGGRHAYYAYQPGVGKDVAPGVELLGDGKIATAPFSEHISGARYRWAVEPW